MENIDRQYKDHQKDNVSKGSDLHANPGKKNDTPDEIHKKIENHKISARHLQNAVKLYIDAAKYLEIGEYDKALECAGQAQESIRLATLVQGTIEQNFLQSDDIKW